MCGATGGKVRLELLAYHDFVRNDLRVIAVRVKAGAIDTGADPRFMGKLCNRAIRDANDGILFHQTTSVCIPSIMVKGIRKGGHQPTRGSDGGRTTVMSAILHCADRRVTANDPWTKEGYDRADYLATKMNEFIHDSSVAGIREVAIGNAASFTRRTCERRGSRFLEPDSISARRGSAIFASPFVGKRSAS